MSAQAINCIFCKIASRQTNSELIYEDDQLLAFLDINPISEGHSLVVLRQHFVDLTDVDPEILGRTIQVAQKLSRKMRAVLGADGVNLFVASGKAAEQTVFHFHLHVIPRKNDDGPKMAEWWKPRIKATTREGLASLTKKLRFQ